MFLVEKVPPERHEAVCASKGVKVKLNKTGISLAWKTHGGAEKAWDLARAFVDKA